MSRGDGRRAWGVFLGALVLRLAHAGFQNPPLPIVGDAREYWEFARHLVETGRYFGPAGELSARMPGYPLFLALVRVPFGDSVAAVIAVQCALGALTCVLLYRIARRLLPEPWPLACGVFAACSFDLVSPSAHLFSECLYSLVFTAAAWALCRDDWKAPLRAVIFGALSGALYLIRPEPLPWILAMLASTPALIPAAFARRHAAVALAAFALLTAPWVARNADRFGRLIPASTVGRSVGYLTLVIPSEQFGWAPDGRKSAPAGLGELERDEWYGAEWKALRSRLSAVQLVRAYAFNLISILYPFLPEYDWTYAFLLPFSLIGFVLAGRDRALRPFALAVFLSLGVLTFFGGPASRYRQGIAPFLVLLATAGLRFVVERAGLVRARAAIGGWLGANLLVWLFAPQARAVALWLKGGFTR